MKVFSGHGASIDIGTCSPHRPRYMQYCCSGYSNHLRLALNRTRRCGVFYERKTLPATVLLSARPLDSRVREYLYNRAKKNGAISLERNCPHTLSYGVEWNGLDSLIMHHYLVFQDNALTITHWPPIENTINRHFT